MSAGDTQIVQTARKLHHAIGHASDSQAQFIFDNATALNPSNDMFDHHPRTRNDPIEHLVRHTQRFAARLFLGCVVNTPAGA